MKVSENMMASIEAVEKVFSFGAVLEKTFGVEFDEVNRNDEGCYDWCDLHHPLDAENKYITVNYDGEISTPYSWYRNAEELLAERK